MRILLAASVILLPLSASAQTVPSSLIPEHCKVGADKAGAARRAAPSKLGDQPPAKQYRTVWRTDDRGCPTPVVVREGIGSVQR